MWQYVLQVLRLIFLLSGHYEAHRVLGVLINCFLLGRGGGVGDYTHCKKKPFEN